MKKIKLYSKTSLILVNIILVLAVLLNSFFYARKQGQRKIQQAEQNFISTSISMQKVASGIMRDQQLSCNEWASFINSQNYTIEQALKTLSQKDISGYIFSHIIDYDTLIGYADVYEGGKYFSESFSSISSVLQPIIIDLRQYDISKTHITQNFINPITGFSCVGFCQDITLVDDGNPKHYLLMRTVRMNYISDQLFFPDYNDAVLSLITSEGDFVIRPKEMENENFWEYIRVHNNLSFSEKNIVKNNIDSVNVQVLELLDDDGIPSLFVCIPTTDGDWQFVSYIQKASISNKRIDLTIVFIVLLGLALIIGIDGAVLIKTNKKLMQSIEETRRANLAKTSFLSSMSHDIRTPMNAITGMATIAMRSLDNPEQTKDCLQKITLASNHLLTLINDVLDISKIESGKLSLNPAVFSLAEAAENLMNIVRLQLREKGLSIEVRTSKIIEEYLIADEVRLNQIFINLLTNAVKYTDTGGKITLTLEENVIPGDNENILLIYSVSDTGIGMSKDFQKTMYDSFSRAVDTRVNKITGTGLGLSITKQMVDLMGGTIECESEIGKGTTFTVKIKLPISKESIENFTLPAMNILLVDDDTVFLATASETLKSIGIEADVAKDGKTAIDMITKKHETGHDYPMVITDWKMPGMDGLELTHQIRSKLGYEIPIIVISSYDRTEVEEEATKAGANAFINKPFFRSTVYYKLSEILNLETETISNDTDDFSDLNGMKILVAEDNDLNWEITNELLSYYGVETFHAENGRECVGMIERAELGDYDLILMDVQMPLMNGKDATRAIRALKTPLSQSITIIAMTADAFAEDMQACLDAGMNGHIPKPVDLRKLLRELRKSIGGGGHTGIRRRDHTLDHAES